MHNRQVFIDTLTACGRYDRHGDDQSFAMDSDETPSQDVSPEIYDLVAKLLVELVTPDIIYNAIVPWPEEDFMRITVER